MKKIINLFATALLIIGTCGISNAQSQKHHVSVLNTTHQDFTFYYQITPTTYKIIEYFIVEASGSVIKVAFNACDVCYAHHLGYSQVGTDMKCNNCSNQYAIDNLGTNPGGGCWPGYLAHTVVGDSIVVEHADLVAGAYYFLLQTNGVGIEESKNKPTFNVVNNNNNLILTMSSLNKREISILDINGKKIHSTSSSEKKMRINVSEYSAGVYFVSVIENNQVSTQKIVIE